MIKFRRLYRLLNGAAWLWIILGTGVIAGLFLSTAIVGIPRAEHPPIIGPHSIEYLDLAAQRSMSDAAWWMVLVSAVSATFGTAGIYLIWRTLRETQRTADAAIQAAKISEIGVRAFLSVEYSTVENAGNDLVVRYKVRNSGASPARDVAFKVEVTCDEFGFQPVGRNFKASITKSRSDVPAAGERNAKAEFDFKDAMAVANSLGVVSFECRIVLSYTDVFGVRHSETSLYGNYVNLRNLTPKAFTLYRDVGHGIGWGD